MRRSTYIIENTIKNILLIIIFAALYQYNADFFARIAPSAYPTLLTVVSILIVGALFSCFTFTYAHTKLRSAPSRYMAHLLTILNQFCTGILLEIMVILVNLTIGFSVWILSLTAVLFYISLVLYDFWDLFRHAEFLKA